MADPHKNEMEIAWAAGLFEGEGCIVVGEQTGCKTPRVTVTLGSTDRDVLERFVAVMGVGNIRLQHSGTERWRAFYVWAIHGKRALPAINMLLPFLGVRRSEKAQNALLAISQIGPLNADKTHCPQGHEYSPENTYIRKANGSRRCRACSLERSGRKAS